MLAYVAQRDCWKSGGAVGPQPLPKAVKCEEEERATTEAVSSVIQEVALEDLDDIDPQGLKARAKLCCEEASEGQVVQMMLQIVLNRTLCKVLRKCDAGEVLESATASVWTGQITATLDRTAQCIAKELFDTQIQQCAAGASEQVVVCGLFDCGSWIVDCGLWMPWTMQEVPSTLTPCRVHRGQNSVNMLHHEWEHLETSHWPWVTQPTSVVASTPPTSWL